MEYFNNTLCVGASWLLQLNIMTESQYRHSIERKQVNLVRRACRNTPALISYESLPQRFKDEIVCRFGNPYDSVKQDQFCDHIVPDGKAQSFFDDYQLPDGRYLKSEIRKEYCANVSILNALHEVLTDRQALRKALGNGRRKSNWEGWSKIISDLDRTKYPHTLPENPRRLQQKYHDYLRKGYESLIHRNFCNKSAAKINDDYKESLLTELLADPRNLDNAQIARIYNMSAEPMSWKKITSAAIAVWRDKLDLIIEPGRRGTQEFMNNKAMQQKRKKPTCPLYFWTLDGWDVELLYQQSEPGRTTYHNRLTVVVVLDPVINYPVGYAIGTHETPELIREALRNAINHTQELFGDRYTTNQLQSDRYSIKTLMPLYEGVADKATPAKAKNSKSKTVERYFLTLNKNYCQMAKNWSGFGITADKDKQPNVEYLNKYKHEFPDINGCYSQIEKIISVERTYKVKRYLELWEKTPQEHKLILSSENYLFHFGAETGYTNRLTGSGLHPTIEGVTRDYDCFDLEFRQHFGENWIVKYDPSDLSKVLAVNEDGTLRFMLEEKYVQPMALRDRVPGDSDALKRVNDYNKQAIEYITDKRAASYDKVLELHEENPQLNNTLSKLLIVDSNGQHKNERNAQRFAASRRKTEQSERKQLKEQAQEQEDLREELFSTVDFSLYENID